MYVAKMKTNNREILIQNQIFINVVIVAVNISMTYYYYLLDYIMSKFQICTYTYSRSFSFCLLWFLQTGEVIALFVSSGNLQCSIAKLRRRPTTYIVRDESTSPPQSQHSVWQTSSHLIHRGQKNYENGENQY